MQFTKILMAYILHFNFITKVEWLIWFERVGWLGGEHYDWQKYQTEHTRMWGLFKNIFTQHSTIHYVGSLGCFFLERSLIFS